MRLGRALAMLAVAVLPASCVAVLGIDPEPKDAVALMCACDIDYPGEELNCNATLNGRLTSAIEATRAEWLRRYVDEGCDTCGNAWKCFQASPTCSHDNSCKSDIQCCSKNGAKAACDVVKGTCK